MSSNKTVPADHLKTADQTLQGVYLWQGFASAGPLSEKEASSFGGEIGAVGWVVEFAQHVDAAFRAAIAADLEYPGVFAYEVTEELGRWLRQNTDATVHDVQRQLLARMSEGYEVDCSSLFPDLPPVADMASEEATAPVVPRDTTGWTATAQDGDPASGPIWAVRDANKKWVLGVPRADHPDAAEAISYAAATEHIARASASRSICPPIPERAMRHSSALDR